MQKLVQDLLAFSRVGRQDTELRNTDCKTVVEAALQNLEGALQESGAVVKHEQLPVVMADGSQLTQVFQNLIGNAIKFRGSSPPVVQIKAEMVAREWMISVADNGIGIAAEHVESVFVIFRRLHTREEYSGNGIGLSICKQIVERPGVRHEGKYAEAPSPDLVVLDLNLPRRDGRQVLSDIKTDASLAKVPVVIFTTSQANSDITRSYELGANCYLRKPGTLPEFVAVVQSMAQFWLGFARLPQREKR